MPASHDDHPLHLLLKTSLDAVVVMNSDGIITEWNDCAAEVFGWPRDQAIGRALLGDRGHRLLEAPMPPPAPAAPVRIESWADLLFIMGVPLNVHCIEEGVE